MFPIAAAGSFCEQIFLDPTKMKIYVQGSEVEPAKILSSLEEKETFGIDIFDFLEQDEIIDSALEGRIAVSEERDPAPPYNIAVHVSLGTRHGAVLLPVRDAQSLLDVRARLSRYAEISERAADRRGHLLPRLPHV